MAAEQPFDPDTMTPEQFAGLVSAASDEQILEVVRGVGVQRVLDRIFAGFEERFRPERAQGVDDDVQFVVHDEGGEYPYVVAIHGGACTASAGTADSPKVTLTLGVVPFVKLVAGKEDGMKLFMAGALKVSGDLMFAPRIMGFFDRPSA